MVSCSPEKPPVTESRKQEISRPADDISLEITPLNVTHNSRIYAVPRGFTLSDAGIEWFVNGYPASGSMPGQFSTADAMKNDEVQARAIVKGSEIWSDIITIKNSSPEISKVRILPEVFRPGDTLYVEASGIDIDGDEVTISYEWTKNGEPAGQSKQIEGTLRRGDKISVRITPFDGEDYGRPGVLHREILNLPPAIIDGRKHRFTGNLFTHQVKANDPDGDPLTYSLKSSPSGMTINSSTGLVKWDVPPEFTGKTSFIVSVSDGHGGEAAQTIVFEIRIEQKR